MATTSQLPEGRFHTIMRGTKVRYLPDRLKIIVPLTISVDGTEIEHDQFMTVDSSLVTSSGKKRALFTTDALEVLGAKDAPNDLADAIERHGENSAPLEIELSGFDAIEWRECVVAHSNGYVDVNIYKPKERGPVDGKKVKSTATGLRAIGAKSSAPAAPAANPFADRGKPIAPPGAARPGPIAPPKSAPTGSDTSFP